MPPLTHAQLPIWVGQSLTPDSPLYNMAFAFVFPQALRADWFREAWRRVTRDSDALRSRLLVLKDGSAEMAVDRDPVDLVVLAPGDAGDSDESFLEWCRQRSTAPFAPGGVLVDSILAPLPGGRTGWFLNQHHLIADAWSTRLVYERVAEEYAVLAAGDPAAAHAASSYYEAVATLPMAAGENASTRAHWAARTGAAGALRLYGRSGRPTSTASTRLSLTLDAATSHTLDRLSRRDGVGGLLPELSRFALFAALVTGWLSRVTGETELSIDTPVGGRPTPAARRSIGLFIEMFPFAVQVSSTDSLSSLGAKCLDEASRLLTFAVPGTGRHASGGAGVVLNFIPGSFGAFAGQRPAITWIHPGHGDRAHVLRVQVHDFTGSGRYTLDFDFNDEALPPRSRRRSLEHFTRLLDAAIADPDRPLAEIDIRTAEERRAFLALNETSAQPLPTETVVDMFLERARLDEQRVALRQQDREVTFGELLARSNAVAEALKREGIAPGDTVAIAGRRSILSVVGILGILGARAAYVPLDPAFPAQRLRYIVEDSGARVVLLGEGLDPPELPQDVRLLSIASLIATPASVDCTLPSPTPDDLAYLLYTSGSTGRPKGVPITHAGLAGYLRWADRRYVRGDRLTYPLFTALTFDLTVTSLFLPLITGGTLEIYPESGGPADTAVMDVVSANRVDFIKLTPSHLSLLRQVGLAGSRIRRMVVGGEDLKTSLAAAVTEQIGSVEIHNEYGPTEAVVGCVAHLYDPSTDLDGSVPIGAPADHVQVEILNDALVPVPEGVPGELWISRHGLARGYHRLPELTSERFRPHPGRPGAVRYRSGDLVRLAAPDRLEYLGRIDRQVKVAGHRIELAEVEAALLDVPQVRACAVAIRHASGLTARPNGPVRRCERCGLPSNYPRADIDATGLCAICRSYTAIRLRTQAYFRSIDDLQAIFDESRSRRRSEFDCLMLYSGGKDSTYALCRLVEMGLSVYAFTLDNGFLSESARDNIRKVTAQLSVPLHFASTPGMNAIFRDSLARFSNVCNGCFKTIYTLGMLKARELGIPIVVTGLSRGQMFETRLTPALFADGHTTPEDVDDAVLAARKAYHRSPDAVSQAIDVSAFEDDALFDQVRVVDFYRYCDVSMDELYAYLLERVAWVRPKDTGRSTNCLINDVGIYVHTRERGFHNYALPYSWDVRLGHKTRSAALAELDDDIDEAYVRQTLSAIGYDERRLDQGAQPTLEAFYVAPAEIPQADLARALAARLPQQFVPVRFHRVDRLPLTVSGKVDVVRLLQDTETRPTTRVYTPPEGVVQEFLATSWRDELGVDRVGADDNFFELGGSSLTGMQMMVRLCREYDIHLPLSTVFSYPRLADLARLAEDAILGDST